MRDRVGLLLLIIALLAGIGWVTRRRPPPPRPRAPVHASVRPRQDPQVRAVLEEVGALREIRRRRSLPAGGGGDADYARGFERAAGASAETLYYLEEIALDRREDPRLRIDLIDLVARHRGEETRSFLAALVGDPEDVEAVRLAALSALQRYPGEPTFEALRRALLDPAPFSGRYHLLVALGENGWPAAVPLLRGALGAGEPSDMRRHAAIGLGGFVGDPAVRAELRRRAAEDPDPFVRQNALGALSRSPLKEVDEFLEGLAASGDEAARALLAQRGERR
jgi:HEAT repeat protein